MARSFKADIKFLERVKRGYVHERLTRDRAGRRKSTFSGGKILALAHAKAGYVTMPAGVPMPAQPIYVTLTHLGRTHLLKRAEARPRIGSAIMRIAD